MFTAIVYGNRHYGYPALTHANETMKSDP
jgi:hypothetical protein